MAVELPAARARTASSARPTAALISADNPLGLNPDDPNGQDDVVVEGGDLHLPIGKPVKVLLRSIDVLHDFYVPEFRAKMDMIPGIGHLFLVHADADRHLRGALRRTVRHRARADARQRRGRHRGGLPGLAAGSSRPSRSCRRREQTGAAEPDPAMSAEAAAGSECA